MTDDIYAASQKKSQQGGGLENQIIPKFSKNSQEGEGQKILNIPKFQNIPKLGGGVGGSERLGVFPKFYRFFNRTASLSIHAVRSIILS